MGKTDNIRRAKKLKEAKRKREFDAELQKSMDNDLQMLSDKYNLNGGQLVIKNKSPLKYSAIILDYLKPFLSVQDVESETKLKIAIGIYAWNVAVEQQLNIDSEKEVIVFREMLDKIEISQALFNDLLSHKKANFSDHEFIVSDFTIGKIVGGQVQLSVVVALPEVEKV